MIYKDDKLPTPQLEEGITEIAWATPEQALLKEPMYENIKSVIRSFVSSQQDGEEFKYERCTQRNDDS